MAGQALRVLAVACREFPDIPQQPVPQSIEANLTFLGLLGMIDPPRSEARDAVAVCRSAGIRAIMITGDHKDTALAIAKNLGISGEAGRALTGAELDALSKEELRQVVKETSVFARVSPENKVAIVTALQENNEIAAMTGDGVNDAPALKKADIGIAMGITGTDVAKETADMVLTDDNFASIVAAVEEGRVIFSNIRKFVFFLLSCNIAEILIIFTTMLLGWPIPLLPIQLLWLNLVTDAFPALALGMEKKEPDVMKVKPRNPQEPLLDRRMKLRIAVQSTVLALAVIGAFRFALNYYDGDLIMARTYAFVTLILAELIRAYSTRAEHYSVFTIGFFSNRYMNLGVGVSFAMLLLVMYIPFLRDIFKLALIDFRNFEVILAFALLPFLAAELGKVMTRAGK
jgi:Ca2+-transporting ATPase